MRRSRPRGSDSRGAAKRAALAVAALVGLAVPVALTQSPSEAAAIRILPLPGEASGKTLIETLTVDPAVQRVVFYLDGVEVGEQRRPPYDQRIELAKPPREQELRAVAFGAEGELGTDSFRVNRRIGPLAVEISGLERSADQVTVSGVVQLPWKTELEEVVATVGEVHASTDQTRFALTLPLPAGAGDETLVQVTARLADGREVEDAQLLGDRAFGTEVDVHLVELQVLVTEGNGIPVRDLGRDAFEVRQSGKRQEIDRVYLADDVRLVLGLALDSSGSMASMWQPTRQIAEAFLRRVMGIRDRAFLVNFDTQLRLAQGLTGDADALVAALDDLQAEGGTALYDSILFSLLQYGHEPGRRGLVVLSDGYDVNSTADPRRVVDLGRRFGVPVYIIAVEPAGGGRQALLADGGDVRGEMRLLTEPTGGRLFRAPSFEVVGRAFAQIAEELRSQYLVVYRTDERPAEGKIPEVRVEAPGRKKIQVRTTLAFDTVP